MLLLVEAEYRWSWSGHLRSDQLPPASRVRRSGDIVGHCTLQPILCSVCTTSTACRKVAGQLSWACMKTTLCAKSKSRHDNRRLHSGMGSRNTWTGTP